MLRNKKIIIISGISFFAVCIFIWVMSSQPGRESNSISQWVSERIEHVIKDNFPVNEKDYFWKVTLNAIVRKAAHFTEYFFLGASMTLLIYILSGKVRAAAVVSVLLLPLLAYADELHQGGILGRTPRTFDVQVDSFGAVLAVILTSTILFLFAYIRKLHRKISDYEIMMKNK